MGSGALSENCRHVDVDIGKFVMLKVRGRCVNVEMVVRYVIL